MTCDATIQTAAHGGRSASQPLPAMIDQSAPCDPAESIEDGPNSDGSPATTLASIRRRLSAPAPGSLMRLRHRQRDALHMILGRGR